MRSTSILNNSEDAFTLIEFLMVLALLGILATLSINLITNTLNESRYAATQKKLLLVRKALVGDVDLRFGQKRSDFGYLGDVGAIPSAAQGLAALITNPGVPVAGWSMNATARIGMGWSGPYLKSDDSDSFVTQDDWGSAFVYSPSANPPTVVSLGADRAVGGTGYNADLTMQLPINTRLATVHGFILQNGLQWSGNAEIELNVPNGSGVLQQITVSITAADKGYFTFSNVPMGVRSATVYVPSKSSPTQTIGPAIFTVDQPHVLIQANLFDLVATVGPTNLEVPIEMFDYGLSSGIVGILNTFERSRTSLNTADYDGTVTYSFEIVATNSSLVAQTVSLINSSGATVTTISVPTGTTTPTRFRVSMTPTNGIDNYRVQFPITLLVNQTTIYSARILVKQVGASKTSIYVPLLSSLATLFNNGDLIAIDTTNSTSNGQPAPLNYSIWKKESSLFSLASGTPYTFEAVLVGGLLGSASATLYNKTSNLPVTGASVNASSLIYTLQQAPFADNATNFTDLADFEVRISSSSVFQTVGIAKAGLWIRLANLGSGAVYYRVARAYTGAASPIFNGQRALIDTTLFSNPVIFAEGVASSSSATGTAVSIFDAGTNDTATGGANVAGSSLTWGTSKSRQRVSTALSLTSGNRFFGNTATTGGQTSNVTAETVIIQFHY